MDGEKMEYKQKKKKAKLYFKGIARLHTLRGKKLTKQHLNAAF